MATQKQVLVGTHWEVKHKLGSGSFGEIYLGIDRRTQENVAIKVESLDSKYPQLVDEYNVYKSIEEARGIPKVLWCGTAGKCTVMVMELLGESLEALHTKCGRKFSLKTVAMLAIQLLERIEWQHGNGFLHRDIKPDNFLMGLGERASTVYMIDMGLSKRYLDPVAHKHIPYRENKKMIGTPRFASINTHLGIESCRRDDLESIGYMLMYFNLGSLPWQGMKAKTKHEKYEKISQKKISTPAGVLCKDVPPEFADFIVYCRSLRFTAVPDYNMWKNKFRQLLENLGLTNDGVFDWMVTPEIPKPLSIEGPRPRALNVSSLPSGQKTDKLQQLMEAYEAVEAERDKYKRRCEEKDVMIQKQLREIQLLTRHIGLHCPVPFPPASPSAERPSQPRRPPPFPPSLGNDRKRRADVTGPPRRTDPLLAD